MAQLSISNLKVSYDKSQIINGLDLNVESAEILGLFGPSGCGKSTVLKAISGLLEQVEGDIEVAGKSMTSIPTENRNIGLIFQDYALFPHLTVAENIGFGLDKKSSNEKQQRVEELLALVNLVELAHQYPHQLSGGQQQRVAIARALAPKPQLLLFDEAFSNLDPHFRFELIEEVRSLLKGLNTTAIFVTHNQDEAFAFCDRIAVMQNGEIAQVASPHHLFAYPASRFVAEFLGKGVWLSAKIVAPDELESSWGVLPYSGVEDLSQRIGEKVEVYVRPHQIGLLETPDGQVEILNERFVGEFYQSEVPLNGNALTIKTHDSYLNKRANVRIKQPITQVFNALK